MNGSQLSLRRSIAFPHEKMWNFGQKKLAGIQPRSIDGSIFGAPGRRSPRLFRTSAALGLEPGGASIYIGEKPAQNAFTTRSERESQGNFP